MASKGKTTGTIQHKNLQKNRILAASGYCFKFKILQFHCFMLRVLMFKQRESPNKQKICFKNFYGNVGWFLS